MSRHGIDLEKGECVEVTSGIRRIMVGCGWDPHKERSRHAFDLDVACVLLEANGKMASRKEFVYYGNKQYGAETVVHTGDNLTGEGDGDDERILMDLTTIPTSVTQIDIFVAIYQARAREQSFGMISDCYIRIVDVSCEEDCTRRGPLYNSTSYPGREFCRFNIDEGAANCDCVQFGTLHGAGLAIPGGAEGNLWRV
jgi:tellurium resistance protein TerD